MKIQRKCCNYARKKDNLLNKKDERKVINGIWSAIITLIKVNKSFFD